MQCLNSKTNKLLVFSCGEKKGRIIRTGNNGGDESYGALAKRPGILAARSGILTKRPGTLANNPGALTKRRKPPANNPWILAARLWTLAVRRRTLTKRPGILANNPGCISTEFQESVVQNMKPYRDKLPYFWLSLGLNKTHHIYTGIPGIY